MIYLLKGHNVPILLFTCPGRKDTISMVNKLMVFLSWRDEVTHCQLVSEEDKQQIPTKSATYQENQKKNKQNK